MARLTVRQLTPRDIPGTRRVQQHIAEVTAHGPVREGCGVLDRAVSVVAPRDRGGLRVFVALVDDEVCAYVGVRPDRERFAWHVVSLAAGSPRLDAHDADVVELWSSLLEFAVQQAGESGAKRLFADCHEGSIAHASLSRAGFEGYTTHSLLVGTPFDQGDPRPRTMGEGALRLQEPSDVWSVHHLYHRITPRAVQFAEARTSASWDLPRTSRFDWIPIVNRAHAALVYETTEGIEAYCRVRRSNGDWQLELLIDPTSDVDVRGLIQAAAQYAGISRRECMRVLAPGYAQGVSGALEQAGFVTQDEHVAMVRHTTAPAAIHVRVATLAPLEATERAVRGIPTYTAHLAGVERIQHYIECNHSVA